MVTGEFMKLRNRTKNKCLSFIDKEWWCKDGRLTGNDEGIDGDPVILVLLVWVGTPQAQPGEEGAKKVADQPDDDKGCHQADVAWKLECVDNQSIFSTPEPVKVRIAACLCFFLSFLSFLSVACSQIRGRHSGHAAAHTQQGGVLSPGMPLFPGPLFCFKKYNFPSKIESPGMPSFPGFF